VSGISYEFFTGGVKDYGEGGSGMITHDRYKEMIEKIAGVAAEYGFYQYKDKLEDSLFPDMPGRTHEYKAKIYLFKGRGDSAEAPPDPEKPPAEGKVTSIRTMEDLLRFFLQASPLARLIKTQRPDGGTHPDGLDTFPPNV
jgi:hypothetical protein